MKLSKLQPNRLGKVTEYKKGHHYLTHTKWEDGHTEIEVHRCIPELVWHSCDQNQLSDAFAIFEKLSPQNMISERSKRETNDHPRP